jgi:hypothetical protein
MFLPLLGGGWEGVLELYSERPHLDPPLRGEEYRIRGDAVGENAFSRWILLKGI